MSSTAVCPLPPALVMPPHNQMVLPQQKKYVLVFSQVVNLRFQTDENKPETEHDPANPPQELFRVTRSNGKVKYKYHILYRDGSIQTISPFGYVTTGVHFGLTWTVFHASRQRRETSTTLSPSRWSTVTSIIILSTAVTPRQGIIRGVMGECGRGARPKT